MLRERIAKLPDGVYEAVDWNEFDGHEGPDQLLELRLRADRRRLRPALRATPASPQIDAFVNSHQGADVRAGA